MSAPWLRSSGTVGRSTPEVPQDVKDAVRARAAGRCECCGINAVTGNTAYHHRRAKGMGGSRDSATHTPQNVVLVCGRDNKSGCHGDIHGHPFEAREAGWTVRQGADPARVPVLLHDGRTAFLAAGHYSVLPEGESA
jgi:hypothetical protein